MKFFNLILAIFISASIINCSQEDTEDENTNEAPIDKAQYPNTKGTILGGWSMDKAELLDKVTVVTNFYVNRDRIAFERTCSSPQQILLVTGEAPARVTGSSVQISTGIQALQQKSGISCGLEIRATEIDYTMMGPDRIQVVDGPDRFTATRITSGGGTFD